MITISMQEDVILVNIYAFNIGALKYIKQILTDVKGAIDNNTIIVGGFNVLLTSMDRPFRQKTVKETQVLHGILDQIELMGHSIQKQQNTCIQNIL